MIRKQKGEALVLGGESRADLLPSEVLLKRKAKVVRRRLGFVILVIALLVIGGTALVRAQAQQAQANLAIEQANTQSLLMQQRKYVEVRKVQQQVDTIMAAQQVGTATEINWEQYLTSVQATLPPNVTIDTINVDSATPFAPYTQATAPLQGARIATLSFTAKSSTLPQVPAWLDALTTLPGYADASPGSVTRNETGAYSVSITMHINEAAFTNRFALTGK
jgi:Tfp pilus assembly protein PilN